MLIAKIPRPIASEELLTTDEIANAKVAITTTYTLESIYCSKIYLKPEIAFVTPCEVVIYIAPISDVPKKSTDDISENI